MFKFEKNYTLEKNSEFLLTLEVSDETEQTWTMFSDFKALVDLEKFRVSIFQYWAKKFFSIGQKKFFSIGQFFSIWQKTITQNLEFSLPSMIPCVIEKIQVIVFAYRAKKRQL